MKRIYPRLVVSDKKGRLSCHPELEAAGMAAGRLFRIDPRQMIKLPPGSRLFMMPERFPAGYDGADGGFEILKDGYLAIAAFLAPGYTAIYSTAYAENGRPRPLPLFSYTAVALHKDEIYVPAVRVDRDIRHDSRFIDISRVNAGIKRFRKVFPRNRLARHLERCALSYGCPGAQNFFLSRYECPLPASPSCNARCAGCISRRAGDMCRGGQPRIRFVPTPQEISDLALFHIANVRDPILSFGQGCEGEPLLVGGVIEKAISMIRQKTSKGTINMNTNGSRPEVLRRLFDAGLDSVRISTNSVQGPYYMRYYEPAGYTFGDVVKSVETAKREGGFVSINYLTMPGFTDSKDEFTGFNKFIGDHGIDMVQWRNLNFDPLLYFKKLRLIPARNKLMGIDRIMDSLKANFPGLMMGYFNPSKATITRSSVKRAARPPAKT